MENPPKPFVTDGCSGGLSYVWKLWLQAPTPWEDLCVEHDRCYWRGGTAQERLVADRILRDAVAARGYPVLSYFLYAAVRVMGHPFLPFSWRWGYGWSYPRGYRG